MYLNLTCFWIIIHFKQYNKQKALDTIRMKLECLGVFLYKRNNLQSPSMIMITIIVRYLDHKYCSSKFLFSVVFVFFELSLNDALECIKRYENNLKTMSAIWPWQFFDVRTKDMLFLYFLWISFYAFIS